MEEKFLNYIEKEYKNLYVQYYIENDKIFYRISENRLDLNDSQVYNLWEIEK